MRRIRQSPLSRWLSCVVVAAFLTPTTFFPSPWVGAAFAQTAHTTRVGRALVLDFEVKEGVDAARLTELALGRHAADALTLALSATGRYDVVSRSDLENALRSVSDNVLSPNKSTQLKLAALPTVRAQSVFVGRVVEVKVWDKPARAQITLEVLERDVLTGEYVNAVRVTDASLPKLGRVKSDLLILEALNRATRRATEEMQARRPLQGNVSQIPSSDAVVLNIGVHQGVEIGQRFAVLRGTDNAQYVGLAEVTQLSADSAVARVTPVANSGGLRPGDRVRQIYAGAPVGVPPTGGGGGGGGGGGLGQAGGLIAGLLFLGLLAGGIGKSQKGGANAEATQNVTAAASSTGNSNLVKWSLSGAFSDLEIIGHFIHRSNFPGFAPSVVNVIDFVPGAQRQYLDAPGDYQNDVTITVTDDQTELGQLDLQTQITALTGGTIPPSTGNLPPPGIRVEDIDVTCVHTGPTVGVQQFYAVTRIVRAPRELTPGGTGQGGTGGGQTVVAPAAVASRAGSASGGATALSPVILVSPPAGSADVAFQNVTFEFQPTAGADEYQIQVSVDPSFPPNNRFASQVIRDTRQGVTLSQTFTNLVVPGAALNTAIYWRVGARNSRDPLRPQGITTSNDDGFVFSQAQTFTLREQPPQPPQSQRVLNDGSRIHRRERRERGVFRQDKQDRHDSFSRKTHRSRRPQRSQRLMEEEQP